MSTEAAPTPTERQIKAMRELVQRGYGKYEPPAEHTITPGHIAMVRDGYFIAIRPDGSQTRPARLP